jgi:hypothetical protein
VKRKRHSPEQTVEKLRQAEAELGLGYLIEPLCRKLEISEANLHHLRKLGG